MRPHLPLRYRSAIAFLLLGLLLLHLGSCSETSTPPAGQVGLRVDVRFVDGGAPLRAGGEPLVYERVRVRAAPYDETDGSFGEPFLAEDPIEPGEDHFRLELEVRPAIRYRVEVDVLGSVDPDTTLGGVLFFGREFAEDVAPGQDNSVSVLLTRQFPQLSTEVLADQDEMRLSWTAVDEASRYRIRGTNNEGGRFESVSLGTDTTLAIPPRLTGGGLVRVFRVRAEFTERDAGAYSREVEADLGSPVAPGEITDLAATAITDSSLVLTWTATGDDGSEGQATSYDLRFSTQPLNETSFPKATPVSGLPAPAPAGTPEAVPVPGLSAGTVYYFGLFATDDVPLRSPLALTSAETAPEPDRTPPGRIADLRVTDVAGGSATLLWTAPGDDGDAGTAATYDARISTQPLDEKTFELADPIAGFPSPAPGGSAESFLLEGLVARITYFVAVRATDDEGNLSGLSNVVSFQTLDLVAPDAVVDLAAEALDENRVAITWTAPSDEDGSPVALYDVRWSEAEITEINFRDANEITAPAPAEPGTEQGLVQNGFSRDMQLYFALRSFDGAGNGSELSNLASTRTPDLTPPARIIDLVATAVDQTTILVTWTATGDDGFTGTAEEYDLRLGTEPIDAVNFTDANRIPLADPQPSGGEETIEVSGLVTGQIYYLRLRSTDDAGNDSELSNLASARPTDSTPPAAAVLTVEMTTSNSVLLGWLAPGDDGSLGQASTYDLRYSTALIDSENFPSAIPVPLPPPAPAGTPESAEIDGLDEATTYYFALITEDEGGNPSPLSNVVSATTGTTPPTAPSGLAAAPLSPTSIGLAWQDNADNEENYEVERRRSDEPSFTRIAVLDPGDGVVSYEDSSVLDRQTYTYRVRATNAGGPSAYSNEATATTPIPAPTNFAASALAHDEIRLSWSFGSPDPEGFRIERIGGADWTTVATVSGDLREFLDTELVYLTTYTYRMVAYDGNLTSVYTPEVSDETPDEPPFCSIDPPSLDFGFVLVGSADTLSVMIGNTGGQVLTGAATLEGCTPEYSVLNGSSLSLHRGEEREVQVIFAPQAPGASSCTLVGPDCDPVDLSGVGENTYWSDRFALGDLGVNSTVRALTVAPPGEGFYAGGNFTLAGDQTTSYAAQFIDDAWFGMGPSLNGQVRTLANTQYGLYCGGDFTSPVSAPHHVAEWTGSSWSALSRSPDGIVRTLVEWDFGLVVGGSFDSVYVQYGDPTTGPPGVAEWIPCLPGRSADAEDVPEMRGCNFYSDLYAKPNGTVEVATVWQGVLYVGGSFTQIGNRSIAYLAKLADFKTGWEAVGFNGGVNNPVYALYPRQTELWVGGQFTAVDGQTSLGVASWSGTSWIPRTAGEDFHVVTYAITELNGHIIIGGSWTTSNGIQALNRVAEFDGIDWIPLGTGIDSAGGIVYALHELDGALYVGGLFTSAGGLPSRNIARWEPIVPR